MTVKDYKFRNVDKRNAITNEPNQQTAEVLISMIVISKQRPINIKV